jgi:hypothetical protein
MRAPMRIPSLIALLLLLCGGAACGKEIGDSCIISSDCSPNGDRLCLEPNDNGGYCTVQGCDVDTCPDEAVCVRFFTGGFSNKLCDPATEDSGIPGEPGGEDTDNCSFDELCSLSGTCVPRSSEVRFCMRKCGSSDDCRDEYECRDFALMQMHGGEPVLGTGVRVDEKAQKFCAAAPNEQ